ncbi:MAG: rhamnulokinase [Planctomycetota bacterium]|nr:rhamnulokinase [Planctomycetota bacterium]
MAEVKKYIAVDLGAESGRVMLGQVSTDKSATHPADKSATRMADKLILEQVHRFSNGPIEEKGTLRWDVGKLLAEVKAGIRKVVKEARNEVAGIGVDSWGVDFGLLDADGELIENPYHYRDSRTNGMMEKTFEMISKREIYENTGVQFLQFNSIYQLLAMRLARQGAGGRGQGTDSTPEPRHLLFMADLLSYYLCGKMFGEYSLASTSQLMDMRTGKWSKKTFDKLSLPIDIMPQIVEPGTVVGELCSKIRKELGCGQIPVIAIGSHDTASAVAAVPAGEGSWAYLSSGTWSLMGVEVPDAIINDKTFGYEFTNEGGVENTIRLLKNIMGLWLMQESKRQWQREGTDLSYTELAEMAKKAKPFAAYINPDYRGFLAPGEMPKRINNYLAETGQKPTDDKGQMIRIILESLALKYRYVMEAIEDITGKKIETLHIVGGGIQNELLCQFTSNALGKKVITGPIEATASGNILMQARAMGQIRTLGKAREIIRNSFELKQYQPQEVSLWEKQYDERIKNQK